MDRTDRIAEREYSKKCPECDSKNIVAGNGETYCSNCGLVIKKNTVDLGPEWVAYDSEQKAEKIRTGPPMTYQIPDKGLSVESSTQNTSFFNSFKSNLNGLKRRTYKYTTSVVELNLAFALSEIGRMTYQLGLKTNTAEEASFMYRKLKKEKLVGKKSIEAITSTILYIVCRLNRMPRTFKEIEEVSWINEKEIKKTYGFFLKKLNLKIPPATAADFVPHFCSLLDLNGKIKTEALEITGKIISGELISRQSPITTAATIIYIAAKLNQNPRTFREIADVAGIADGAVISKGCKEISKQLGISNIPN